jgi:hypothetical protein
LTGFIPGALRLTGRFSRGNAGLWSFAAVCLLLSGTVRAETLWESAARAYHAGKFEEAKGDYLQLLSQGTSTPALFYNLGNTWWQLGQKGRAILNYRRALVLEPHAGDAQANLLHALSQTGQDPPSPFRTELSFNADVYPVVASAAFWTTAFALAVGLTSRKISIFRVTAAVAWGSGLLCLLSLGLCWCVGYGEKDPHSAIVLPTSLDLKVGPAFSTRIAETVGEGQEVSILQERGAWILCRSQTGLAGWVPSNALERIVPR